MDFFITGLPRSRTAWLANLFTTEQTFCWHDALKDARTPEGLRAQAEKSRALFPGVRYWGNSDSAQSIFVTSLVRNFPSARWVFVQRPYRECLESYQDAFGKFSSPTQSKENFDRVWFDLGVALSVVPESNQLLIDYECLEKEDCVKNLWEFCVPGISFNSERFRMLDALRVTVIPEKAYPALRGIV